VLLAGLSGLVPDGFETVRNGRVTSLLPGEGKRGAALAEAQVDLDKPLSAGIDGRSSITLRARRRQSSDAVCRHPHS